MELRREVNAAEAPACASTWYPIHVRVAGCCLGAVIALELDSLSLLCLSLCPFFGRIQLCRGCFVLFV